MEGVGHGGDLPRLGDTARVHQVGLGDVDALHLQEAAELALGVEPLRAHDRDRDLAADLRVRRQVVGGHRVLVGEQVEVLQSPGQADRVGHGEAAVAVDEELHLRPHGLAHGFEVGRRLLGVTVVEVGVPVEAGPVAPAGASLQGEVALVPLGLRHRRRRLGGGAAEVGVHVDRLAEGAAEQLVDRQARHLALDVPQGDVDAGQGAHPHGAGHAPDAAHRGSLVDVVPQVLDARRVVADQFLLHVVHGGADHGLLEGVGRLAQAGDPLVGVDPDDGPLATRRGDHQGVDVGDLHGRASQASTNSAEVVV